MASLLTSNLGDLEKLNIEINECIKLKIKVLPPSVNYSFVEFGVNKNEEILYGLGAIKNVGEAVSQLLIDERNLNGEFKNLKNFLERVSPSVINKKTLENLIKSGAMDCFGARSRLFKLLPDILEYNSRQQAEKNNKQTSLFGSIANDTNTNTIVSEKIFRDLDKPNPDLSNIEMLN